MTWRPIGPLEAIPRQGARVVASPTGDVAVFRTADDHVFALEDRCPHKAGKLSQGIVHGHAVTCPLHNWIIDLTTGQATAPDIGQTPTLPTRLEDGQIHLYLPDPPTLPHRGV